MTEKPATFLELIGNITPEIHASLKRAVELGRWPDGERLAREQVELCLQAIILYEERHLPESERTGFVERPAGPSACGPRAGTTSESGH